MDPMICSFCFASALALATLCLRTFLFHLGSQPQNDRVAVRHVASRDASDDDRVSKAPSMIIYFVRSADSLLSQYVWTVCDARDITS